MSPTGSTRSSLASVWNRDSANRDSSQTLVEAHPPGPCQNLYCPSCSKTLPEGVGHPGMPHSGPGNMFEGDMMHGGFNPMIHVVGAEHAEFVNPAEWGQLGDAAGGAGPGGGMFGCGLQETF